MVSSALGSVWYLESGASFHMTRDKELFSNFKEKDLHMHIEKGDSILKYLTKFVQCQDELGSIGITITNDDLVSLALLGLPKSWHSYQDSVNGREKLLEGTNVVGFGARGVQTKHQRWIFI